MRRNHSTPSLLLALTLVLGAPTAEAQCPSGSGITGLRSFPLALDSRVIYVSSSSGNDANSGLSPQAPKKTLGAGYALLRNGFSDRLLLRSGDDFKTTPFLEWNISGRSPTEPTGISTYGGPVRARLSPPQNSGAITNFRTPIRNVFFENLHLEPRSYDPSQQWGGTGLTILNNAENVVLQNLRIVRFAGGLVVQGASTARARNILVQYNVVYDNHVTTPPPEAAAPTHSQGAYFSNIDDLVLKHNFFDENGHQLALPRTATIFNHNVYIQGDNRSVIAEGNVLARAAAHGMQLRPFGIAENNLFLENPIAMNVGSGQNDPVYARNAGSWVTRNVVIGSRDINGKTPRGFGFMFIGGGGHLIDNNIFAHRGDTGMDRAIQLGAYPGFEMGFAMVVDNKVYNWGRDLSLNFRAPLGGTLLLHGNKFHEVSTGAPVLHLENGTQPPVISGSNRMSCASMARGEQCVAGFGSTVTTPAQLFNSLGDTTSVQGTSLFADPGRTVARYYNERRGTTTGLAGFYAESREQGGANGWACELLAPQVNDWVRAGF